MRRIPGDDRRSEVAARSFERERGLGADDGVVRVVGCRVGELDRQTLGRQERRDVDRLRDVGGRRLRVAVPELLSPGVVEPADGCVAVSVADGVEHPVELEPSFKGRVPSRGCTFVVLMDHVERDEAPTDVEGAQRGDPADPHRGLPGERTQRIEEELQVVGSPGELGRVVRGDQ